MESIIIPFLRENMLLEHAVNSVRENPNKGQKLCSAGVAD
jgi:hypothetical protein